MRSAADIEEVGWPDPAAVLQRMESTRSCWPSWRANSRSVVAMVSVTAMSLLAIAPAAGGGSSCLVLVYRSPHPPHLWGNQSARASRVLNGLVPHVARRAGGDEPD